MRDLAVQVRGPPELKGVLVKDAGGSPNEGCGVVDPLPLQGGNSFTPSQVGNAILSVPKVKYPREDL